MTKEQLRKFIRESRELVKSASPEQKIKVLKLIKEAKQQYEQSLVESVETVEQPTSSENADYLEEK